MNFRSKLAALDVNGDGLISFLEWTQSQEAFAHMGLSKLAERWTQYDWEGKGYLTTDEAMHRKALSIPVASHSPTRGEDMDIDRKLARPDSIMRQRPLERLPQVQQVSTDANATTQGWTLKWYDDVECEGNSDSASGTAPQGCSDFGAVKAVSVGFHFQDTFVLKVYLKAGCVGIPTIINTQVDCKTISQGAEGLSWKVSN